jgi:acyl-CoA thioester hydrolase
MLTRAGKRAPSRVAIVTKEDYTLEEQSRKCPSGETRFRVRYAETDQMGVAHHANYLIWMEIGRVELVRDLGLNYGELERQEGLFLSVIEASCRYLAPARYDQEITVETQIDKSTSRTIEFGYKIRFAQDSRLLADGWTRHLWLNREFRPAKLPGQLLARLKLS